MLGAPALRGKQSAIAAASSLAKPAWSISRKRPTAAAGAEAASGDKRGRKDKLEFSEALEKKDLKQVIKLLLKMSLQNQQLLRELCGTVWIAFLFLDTEDLIKDCKEAGKDYHHAVKTHKEEQKDIRRKRLAKGEKRLAEAHATCLEEALLPPAAKKAKK